MTQPLIEFKDVTKRFGDKTVLDRVNLKFYQGEVTTIIGKSGVGKSVLIKHVIGLLEPEEGEILYNGKPVSRMSGKEKRALKREVSYMFQHNALFDSMTVFENIALPLRETTRMKKPEIYERVMEKIKVMELTDVAGKYPSQISGGMQKRTALARALVNEPKVVLFDEPTTGLDPIRKNAVLSMISHYQEKFRFTAILVSHDIPDVLYISNRVALIDEGRILFQGSPLQIEQHEHPVVEQFIHGLDNLKDDLTGLDSKGNLEHRFQALGEKAKSPFSVVVFTVEDVDRIETHLGHLAAQRIIQVFAQLLREKFGDIGWSARYGPGVIAVLLPETDKDKARQIIHNLKGELDKATIFSSISYPQGSLSFTLYAGEAQGRADQALEQVLQSAKAGLEPLARLTCGKQD